MTITEPIIRKYRNGNTTVSIFRDGTKIREVDEGEDPRPIWPESIDLKITDYCDAGCPWCHERSTVRGRHADYMSILRATGGLQRGAELAIGGGNPLDFPGLDTLLLNLSFSSGLICNVTVNARHLVSHAAILRQIRKMETAANIPLIHGLGISYDKDQHAAVVSNLSENAVVHLIVGVDPPESLSRLVRDGARKFLLLGYKRFGRGIGHEKNLNPSATAQRWRYFLPTILSNPDVVVSFDNLGLEQLEVRELIGEELWGRHYMGDDGQFTMYVDAVRREFAVSSTSERRQIGGMGIREMFAVVRQETKTAA